MCTMYKIICYTPTIAAVRQIFLIEIALLDRYNN